MRIGAQAISANAAAVRHRIGGGTGAGVNPTVLSARRYTSSKYKSRARIAAAVSSIPIPPHVSKYLSSSMWAPSLTLEFSFHRLGLGREKKSEDSPEDQFFYQKGDGNGEDQSSNGGNGGDYELHSALLDDCDRIGQESSHP
jgi:hypothetical protein